MNSIAVAYTFEQFKLSHINHCSKGKNTVILFCMYTLGSTVKKGGQFRDLSNKEKACMGARSGPDFYCWYCKSLNQPLSVDKKKNQPDKFSFFKQPKHNAIPTDGSFGHFTLDPLEHRVDGPMSTCPEALEQTEEHRPGFDDETLVFDGNHSDFPLNLPSNSILYQIIRAYELMHGDLLEPDIEKFAEQRKKYFKSVHAWDRDMVYVDNASRFLKTCIRQNSARTAADDIRTLEHLILVQHTTHERLLYLNEVQALRYDEGNVAHAEAAGGDGDDADGDALGGGNGDDDDDGLDDADSDDSDDLLGPSASDASRVERSKSRAQDEAMFDTGEAEEILTKYTELDKRERLLKLCSHFRIGGEGDVDKDDAAGETGRMYERRKREFETTARKIKDVLKMWEVTRRVTISKENKAKNGRGNFPVFDAFIKDQCSKQDKEKTDHPSGKTFSERFRELVAEKRKTALEKAEEKQEKQCQNSYEAAERMKAAQMGGGMFFGGGGKGKGKKGNGKNANMVAAGVAGAGGLVLPSGDVQPHILQALQDDDDDDGVYVPAAAAAARVEAADAVVAAEQGNEDDAVDADVAEMIAEAALEEDDKLISEDEVLLRWLAEIQHHFDVEISDSVYTYTGIRGIAKPL